MTKAVSWSNNDPFGAEKFPVDFGDKMLDKWCRKNQKKFVL